MGVRGAILPGHQSQVLKECPPHVLHVRLCCFGAMAAAVVQWGMGLIPEWLWGPSHSCWDVLVGGASPGPVGRTQSWLLHCAGGWG